MYQFFVDADQIHDKDIYIYGSDFNHIKNVLRMKIGEEVSVIANGEDKEYRCEIAGFSDDEVQLKLRFIKEDGVELPCKIYLFQGMPKSDKLELIVQKAVELGVYEIIPIDMKRSIVKLDQKKRKSRIERYNNIAEAAAKQSKRRIIPEVHDVMSFKEAVKYAEEMNVKILPYELCDMSAMNKTREIMSSIKPGDSVAIFIGPEGGFADEEIELAGQAGINNITLGRRILRTETAGMTVLSWLVYLLEQ